MIIKSELRIIGNLKWRIRRMTSLRILETIIGTIELMIEVERYEDRKNISSFMTMLLRAN